MDSLGDLLNNNQSLSESQIMIDRLKTYINKKYKFSVNISLTAQFVIIYVQNSAQAASLRLDLANLDQLINHAYSIRIKIRPL